MNTAEASWVREHAWTNKHREIEASLPYGFFGLCSCQYGICGSCGGISDRGRPRHDNCLSRRLGKPVTHSAAHLTDRHVNVLADVWTTGTPCSWVCPCPCPKTGPLGAQYVAARRKAAATNGPSGGQLDLFEEAA